MSPADGPTPAPLGRKPSGGWVPARRQAPLLQLAAAVGAGVAVSAHLAGHRLFTFLGVFVAVYSVFLLVSVANDIPILSRRVESFIGEWVREGTSGFSFYGLVAATFFVKWEAVLLIRAVLGFELTADKVIRTFIDWGLGISVESILTALRATVWPLHVLRMYSIVPGAIAILACWGIVRFGARAFHEPSEILHGRTTATDGAREADGA